MTKAKLLKLAFSEAGRMGGSVKSEAKTRAVRENAKLGGRPPLPRCKCGKMTLRLARKRGHVCGGKGTAGAKR